MEQAYETLFLDLTGLSLTYLVEEVARQQELWRVLLSIMSIMKYHRTFFCIFRCWVQLKMPCPISGFRDGWIDATKAATQRVSRTSPGIRQPHEPGAIIIWIKKLKTWHSECWVLQNTVMLRKQQQTLCDTFLKCLSSCDGENIWRAAIDHNPGNIYKPWRICAQARFLLHTYMHKRTHTTQTYTHIT